MPTLRFDSLEMEFHRDRELLNEVMNHSELVRQPNEWWHFSYGNQLWAWISNEKAAIYGGVRLLLLA